MADQELRDKIAAEAEAFDQNPDAEAHYTRHRRRAENPSTVYTVRIPADRIEQLREVAEARGVAPTALMRGWVLAQLDEATGATDPGADRWERDFRATAEHLRQLLDERPGARAQPRSA